VLVLVPEGTGLRVGQEPAGVLVRDDLAAAPGVEQLARGLQELLGPRVAVALRQEAAAAEVLAG